MSDLDITDAEVVESPNLPAVQERSVSEWRPAMVLSPDEAKALSEQVRETTRAVLRDGTDYMVIPGTPKPSMLKPGAEWLLKWFGYGHQFEPEGGIIERDESGKRIGVTYRCVVTKPLETRDVVVASSEGYAGHDEAKWAKAPWNTVIQMAAKRALVAATLRATATSGLFTSDLEDMQQQAPDFGPIVAEVKNRARALSTPDQQERMKAYLKGAHVRLEAMTAAQLADALMELGKIAGATSEEPRVPRVPPRDTDSEGGSPRGTSTYAGGETQSSAGADAPSGTADGGEEGSTPSPPVGLKPAQRKLLLARCREAGLSDDERHALSVYACGKRSSTQMSRHDLDRVLEAVGKAEVGEIVFWDGDAGQVVCGVPS